MSVTYEFLDKNKKSISKHTKTACFSIANNQLRMYPNAVYFKYTVYPTITKEQTLEYIKFLNSIRWFYRINETTFMKNYEYTFKIKNQNSFKTFATLTALRYLEEYPKIVTFVLANKHKRIPKLKLLILGLIPVNPNGHSLSGCPYKIQNVTNFKIKNLQKSFPPDNNIITLGLWKFFGDFPSWTLNQKIKTELIQHYGLIV